MIYSRELEYKILQLIEDDPKADGGSPFQMLVSGYSREQINYHLLLMQDQNLILVNRSMYVTRMTHTGHLVLEGYKAIEAEKLGVPVGEVKRGRGRPPKQAANVEQGA